ncbi:peroxisomal carnitine O-octanoyltransferase [Patella vulgata]|uniref:peroxisomal carnitine O-octanoyltransferase n=1 Tax=Patella vulgata TaxID=6465 RepID=UPI0021801EF5|nr:peroxisomal carnitine O-octanoyltransferase [Patella vulgata]
MASAMFLSDDEKTFGNQESLPSLPIPPLQKTLDRYLDSVKPFVTDEEYKQTEFLVQQFHSGVGKELHFKLFERAKYMRNWLEKWWDDGVYLELRNPNAVFGNMAGPGPYMNSLWPPADGTQIERAGILTYYVIKFWQAIRNQTLRPHKDSKGRPLCMNQFHRMLNTTRIPGPFQDKLLYHFKTDEEGECPTNVIVMCRGRIFTVNVVDDNNEPLTAPEIQHLIQTIETQCSRLPHGDGVGYLPTLGRTEWAEQRSRILALHPDNYHHLQEIEKSIFVLGLDDQCPKSESEVAWQGLGGNPEAKWFDKSLSLTVFKNGLIVSNCDHAPTDAMVLVSCTYFVYLSILEAKGVWQGTKTIRKLEQPRELEFHLDLVVRNVIKEAKPEFKKRCDTVEVLTTNFRDYGKSSIRQFKLHPDTHVQLALQLAYYRKYKRPAPTYETATTRQFYHGRTETMRSCTPEAVTWCKAMLDPSIRVSQILS